MQFRILIECSRSIEISDRLQSCGYEDGFWKSPGPLLPGAADF